VRLPAPVRAVGWRTGRRAVDWSAKQLKLASYVPMYDYREQLDTNTSLTLDPRPIRDKRPSTVSAEDIDLTLTLEEQAHRVSFSGCSSGSRPEAMSLRRPLPSRDGT